MSLKTLELYVSALPRVKRACEACKTFAPECLVPIGDDAVPMCWLCAHHVIEHGCTLHDAFSHECECTPQEIYPQRAFQTPGALTPVAPVRQGRVRD